MRVTEIKSLGYSIHASWGARAETPEAIAVRFLACVDRLSRVYAPNWVFDAKSKPLDGLRDTLPQAIAAKVAKADDGSTTPILGYYFLAINNLKDRPRSLTLNVNVGSALDNFAQIWTGYDVIPDPSIIAYPAFKAALLALAESFDATWCSAYPDRLLNLSDLDRNLRLAWMSYVAPRFAPLITPPPSAIVERTAQGGLLMAATAETFRVDDPAHLAAARDILKALAPFEALPWAPDAAQA